MTLAQDENTRQQLFDQGQIDVLRNIDSEYLDQKQSEIDAGNIQLISGPQPRNSYICFNNEDPNGVFTNEKIRKAFAIAFDREAYATQVLDSNKPAYGEIPPGTAIGTDEFRDLYPEPMKNFLTRMQNSFWKKDWRKSERQEKHWKLHLTEECGQRSESIGRVLPESVAGKTRCQSKHRDSI